MKTVFCHQIVLPLNYTTQNFADTIVALSTPPGVGALGIIRLSGIDALRIVQKVFGGKDLTKQASHTLHFGTITGDDGHILDEVVVSIFKAPHSYTGENVAEVSCHGSSYILGQVLELFVKKGARLAQPGEFTMRAFLNGRMDLSQAEAVADLIASHSSSAHAVAMRQMRGGFSHEIKKLRGQLIDFASLIELELDFAEEDVEFANRDELKKLVQNIQALIQSLINSFKLGNVLRTGVPTVIAGRPNAGKSTLLNALLNEERAIVSEIEGTTRDTIEEVLNINGVEFRLIDTAGLREAQDQIETLGVEKTLEKVRQAALLIYVFDVAAMKPEEVLTDLASLRSEGMQFLVVCNKIDKNPRFEPEALLSLQSSVLSSQVVTCSAKHGMNVSALKEKLYETALSKELNLESPIVTNARHYEALQKASASLDDVLRGLEKGVTSDFVAMDIRQALAYLGEITGEVGVDDLLENIFSKFCIGK